MSKKYYIGVIEEQLNKKGWLIGSFLNKNHPCFSEKVEVGWKAMGPETKVLKHIHKVVIEIWVIIKGSIAVVIDDEKRVIRTGRYVVVHPLTPVEVLTAEEGTIVLVIKAPSMPLDKYHC